LRQRGHEVWLLIFKRFECVYLSQAKPEAWQRALSGTYPPMVEYYEEGTMLVPYIHPATEREWELFLEKLTTIRPDLIGLSVMTSIFDASREMTERIRRVLPGAPIIWGGIHPIICPEESIQVADMVCTGEGEEAMAELAADPERTDVTGIWRRANGRTIQTPIRPLEQNLDHLPFASYGENEWLIEDNQTKEITIADKKYFEALYISMTQRGCPFSCSYCVHHTVRPKHRGERYVRRRSVDHVLDECEQRVRNFNLPSLVFWDDVFVMNPKWIEEFAAKFPKRIGLPFGAYVYPHISTEEMIRQLREAGMVFAGLGIQTGSDYISREIFERNHGAEPILELAQIAAKHGLVLCYDFLSNNPYESEADCLETLRLITRLPKPHSLVVKKVIFFPRTRIATLDKPRHNLPEKTFAFWNQLYLMARHHVIPADQMLALPQDEYLKANPEIVQAIALAVKNMVIARDASRADLDRLLAEERQVSARGLLSYVKRMVMRWLPEPLANALRALKRRLLSWGHS
jgi:radical SAM superfamily enzyme YgiQ (UPF0313 family)